MVDSNTVLKTILKNRDRRKFPNQEDFRYDNGIIWPDFRPKFKLDFRSKLSVFTIGSCFARNIEEKLSSLGLELPTINFSVPKNEWAGRPNGILNEYNPGTISRRIVDAFEGKLSPEATIAPSGSGYDDLLLAGGASVSIERANFRRNEIFEVYSALSKSNVLILTLGLTECWYDNLTNNFLNRMPPIELLKTHPNRFIFRSLDVFDALPILENAILMTRKFGIKVIISVSPVPLQTTFTDNDPVIANEFSKSVLRICAQRLYQRYDNVDYFPSYEIVRSAGLDAFASDNVHVRDEIVGQITSYMLERYQG